VTTPESHFEAETERLLTEYRDTGNPEARERLISMHEPLVRFLAGKFRSRGEPIEDLMQVAAIGLIQAIDRFEPERGYRFSTFATPTIVGEIRRYLRDRTWMVHVPRRLRELNGQAAMANERLSAELGRSPSISEIAAAIGASEAETLEAMESGHLHQTVSLEEPLTFRGEATPVAVGDVLGGPDPNLEKIERYEDLRVALESLNERERRIVLLRFFHGLSQSEVAERLQISQMHVSRLQQRALDRLKSLLDEEEPPLAPAS
jgi:RNA polymerase sigma-B factor